MATTEAALLVRVKDVLVALGFTAAAGLNFSLVPGGVSDGAFTLAWVGDPPMGGMNFSEEARGRVEIQIARDVNDDYHTALSQLYTDVRAVINGLVNDGHVESGEYAVSDDGRSMDVEQPAGASYLVARLRVPINFEAELA